MLLGDFETFGDIKKEQVGVVSDQVIRGKPGRAVVVRASKLCWCWGPT